MELLTLILFGVVLLALLVACVLEPNGLAVCIQLNSCHVDIATRHYILCLTDGMRFALTISEL